MPKDINNPSPRLAIDPEKYGDAWERIYGKQSGNPAIEEEQQDTQAGSIDNPTKEDTQETEEKKEVTEIK